MSNKNAFVFLLMFVFACGCNMMERQQRPDVATVPPYWQSRTEIEQNQMDEMRAFHEGESAQIADEMNVVRNREVERLDATGKALAQNRLLPMEQNAATEQKSILKKEQKQAAQRQQRAVTPATEILPAPPPEKQAEKWSFTNLFKKKDKAVNNNDSRPAPSISNSAPVYRTAESEAQPDAGIAVR